MVFKEFDLSDLELLRLIIQNQQVMRYTLDDISPDAELASYFDRILANNSAGPMRRFYEYKVCEGDQFIGIADIEIVRTMPRGGIAEIGYLLQPAMWNKGYATLICAELIRLCFENLKLHKVVASCNTSNTGSWHVMEKCGMIREATLAKHRFKNGSFADEFKYAIINPLICPE